MNHKLNLERTFFRKKKEYDVWQHSLYAWVKRPSKVRREGKTSETPTEPDVFHAYCAHNIFGVKVNEVQPGQLPKV